MYYQFYIFAFVINTFNLMLNKLFYHLNDFLSSKCLCYLVINNYNCLLNLRCSFHTFYATVSFRFLFLFYYCWNNYCICRSHIKIACRACIVFNLFLLSSCCFVLLPRICSSQNYWSENKDTLICFPLRYKNI